MNYGIYFDESNKLDQRPVRPNCHLALNSKVDDGAYSIGELKEKMNQAKSLV